jgi:hypothetical protein
VACPPGDASVAPDEFNAMGSTAVRFAFEIDATRFATVRTDPCGHVIYQERRTAPAEFGALLYDVKALDPAVFALMSVMMTVIGMLASYMPARRASSVDPIVSLRSD